MTSRTAPAIVLPDCCNLGIILRVLLLVNGVFLAVILLRAPTWQSGLLEFVDRSVLIELATLGSLFVLCGVRRTMWRAPHWLQRLACVLVPALVAGVLAAIVARLLGMDGFVSMGTGASATEAMLTAALFGAVLQHYFFLRGRAASPAMSDARLQALQARIRPHFVFNSLNATLSLIRSDPRQAETTLEDLADLFRVLLRDARDIVSLDDEIRICQQYLSIEQVRLGERLQVHWELIGLDEQSLRQGRMPSLSLQPLLENAVYHGVEPAATPAPVTIQVRRAGDQIDIVVRNRMPVPAPTSGNRMALANIRERLALLYDAEASLTTTAGPEWFEARLRFPFGGEAR